MLFIFLSIVVLALFIKLTKHRHNTYGSQLEEYIVSKNPHDIHDVERLAKEYDLESRKRFL